ncbi:MAG TPA: DUF2846 domain-containing protein [Stellaceae bacterium]|jgi:Protein of unknown function (DUF2846)|nr:DUF2846 domain-containing protein [Stellaceae bacterium]
MSRLVRPVVAVLFLLAGCVQQPPPNALYGPLPPEPPGTARLVFYRAITYYGAMQWRQVYLNGKPSGESRPGTVFYRDVPPGRYDLTIQTDRYYPNQFKTVVMGAGETFYINIDTLPRTACLKGNGGLDCAADAFILTVVSPERGFADIQGLQLIAG